MIVGPAHVLRDGTLNRDLSIRTHNEARGIVVVGGGGHDTRLLAHPLARPRRPRTKLESRSLRLAACYVDIFLVDTADESRTNSSERFCASECL